MDKIKKFDSLLDEDDRQLVVQESLYKNSAAKTVMKAQQNDTTVFEVVKKVTKKMDEEKIHLNFDAKEETKGFLITDPSKKDLDANPIVSENKHLKTEESSRPKTEGINSN